MSVSNDTTVQFDFSDALAALRAGKRVRRTKWDVSFLWLELGEDHIYLAAACSNYGQWLGCEADILATDWVVVEANNEA